jgi:hypothetical protein
VASRKAGFIETLGEANPDDANANAPAPPPAISPRPNGMRLPFTLNVGGMNVRVEIHVIPEDR